ncbi:MAG: hypothetical protein HZB76_01900 [Chlamydiae bacterium]|nr:hypothetical protein [Chlamydiota bacterium]
MPTLIEKPTFTDYQKYVEELEIERGFAEQSVIQKCLMLGEEVGELCEAIDRKIIDVHEVGDEITDVLIFIFSIANRLGIDLAKRQYNVSALSNPTFEDFQKFIKSKKQFNEPLDKQILQLLKELGKLFKSIRKISLIKVDQHSTFDLAEDKLSLIVYILFSIGSYLNLDLEKSFRKKEEINKRRTWNALPQMI